MFIIGRILILIPFVQVEGFVPTENDMKNIQILTGYIDIKSKDISIIVVDSDSKYKGTLVMI